MDLTPSALEIQEWRRRGPLGKLHNIVVFIQRSPQRSENFKTYSAGRLIPRDNSTRWNSWFRMLDTALKEGMQPALDVYTASQSDLSQDQLSSEDWETLSHFHGILKNFEEATLSSEGYKDTIDKVLTSMEFLLDSLEESKAQFINHRILKPCVEAAWNKLEKYYSLTERSVAYTAAMVLVPSQKWAFFDFLGWPQDWIKTAQKEVESLWQTEYKPNELVSSSALIHKPDSEKTKQQRWLESKKRGIQIVQDEYKTYCQASLVSEEVDARKWWSEETQRKTYPNLSIMALDMLSIPAMSASPERLFSAAGLTVTDRRNRLNSEAIEALECLRSWYKLDNYV